MFRFISVKDCSDNAVEKGGYSYYAPGNLPVGVLNNGVIYPWHDRETDGNGYSHHHVGCTTTAVKPFHYHIAGGKGKHTLPTESQEEEAQCNTKYWINGYLGQVGECKECKRQKTGRKRAEYPGPENIVKASTICHEKSTEACSCKISSTESTAANIEITYEIVSENAYAMV